MRPLYCYTEFLDEKGESRAFRGLDRIELNLSTKDRFSFDKATNTLRRAPKATPLPEGFCVNERAENSI